MKNKKKIIASILILFVVGYLGYTCFYISSNKKTEKKKDEKINEVTSLDFEYDFIKKVNESYSSNNYLISPMSVGYALGMLKEGANGNTLKQIDDSLKSYKTDNYNLINNRIAIANGLFIKDIYKNNINKDFVNTLKNKYDSDVLYDKFETPDVINEWVKNKTFGMIEKTLDDISKDFVLGLANTIAIDVEWDREFDCSKTSKENFIKMDGSKVDAVMMHDNESYNLKYFENKDAKGIIKDYKIYDSKTGKAVEQTNKDTILLEYIAILPNDINQYINNFSLDTLKNITQTSKLPNDNQEINLSIPRYKNDFSLENFKEILKQLNMTDMFDPIKANFSNMSDNTKGLYIETAIHKTAIDFNEKGTKAAAVTYFGMDKFSALDDKEKIEMNFNRPFIYIIKEKTSDNIWFFGVVNSPELWTDKTKTCSNFE